MRGKIMRIIRAYELSGPILCYVSINNRGVVSTASVRIKQGMQISEGQIIWAILYTSVRHRKLVFIPKE